MSPRKVYADYATEADFQKAVIDLARRLGWLVHHCRAAKLPSGKWGTPLQGDIGFPDLVLARNHVVIFAELKRNDGDTSEHQDRWLGHLGPLRARTWKPRHWDQIVTELSGKRVEK